MKERLDSITKIINISVPLLIIYGIYYIEVYYSIINLNIINFFEPVELATSFLNITSLILFGILFYILLEAILKGSFLNSFEKEDWSIVKDIIYTSNNYILIPLSLILILNISSFTFPSHSINILGITFIIESFFILIVTLVSVINIIRLKNEDLGSTEHYLIIKFLFLFFIVILITPNIDLALNLQKSNMKLTLNDSTQIYLKKDTVFVGRNKNFTFLFNKYNQSTIVLKNDEIKRITKWAEKEKK